MAAIKVYNMQGSEVGTMELNDNVTIQNLEVVRVDLERNAILIKGAIPGAKGSIVVIANSVKSK